MIHILIISIFEFITNIWKFNETPPAMQMFSEFMITLIPFFVLNLLFFKSYIPKKQLNPEKISNYTRIWCIFLLLIVITFKLYFNYKTSHRIAIFLFLAGACYYAILLLLNINLFLEKIYPKLTFTKTKNRLIIVRIFLSNLSGIFLMLAFYILFYTLRTLYISNLYTTLTDLFFLAFPVIIIVFINYFSVKEEYVISLSNLKKRIKKVKYNNELINLKNEINRDYINIDSLINNPEFDIIHESNIFKLNQLNKNSIIIITPYKKLKETYIKLKKQNYYPLFCYSSYIISLFKDGPANININSFPGSIYIAGNRIKIKRKTAGTILKLFSDTKTRTLINHITNKLQKYKTVIEQDLIQDIDINKFKKVSLIHKNSKLRFLIKK